MPQAKGRVERLFGTFQDRLVKALRLAGLETLAAANCFLDAYLPTSNQRFTVRPAQAVDLHQPSPSSEQLARILCMKTKRVLRCDWTVAHHGQLSQVHDHVRTTHVMIEERLDEALLITHPGRTLDYHVIASRPLRAAEPRAIHKPRRPVKPKPDHPWHRRLLPARRQEVAVPAL